MLTNTIHINAMKVRMAHMQKQSSKHTGHAAYTKTDRHTGHASYTNLH